MPFLTPLRQPQLRASHPPQATVQRHSHRYSRRHLAGPARRADALPRTPVPPGPAHPHHPTPLEEPARCPASPWMHGVPEWDQFQIQARQPTLEGMRCTWTPLRPQPPPTLPHPHPPGLDLKRVPSRQHVHMLSPLPRHARQPPPSPPPPLPHLTLRLHKAHPIPLLAPPTLWPGPGVMPLIHLSRVHIHIHRVGLHTHLTVAGRMSGA